MSDEDYTAEVAERSGLRLDVCQYLLDRGWLYLASPGQVSVWVSPEASYPLPGDQNNPPANGN